MRNLFVLALTVILFTACEQQEQRYFAESDEINTLKSGIKAYESGDWEAWRSHFADTAKIFVNSTEGVSLDDRVANLKEMTAAMSSYGFDKERSFIEMVIDKKDEKWVYFWAVHKGTFAATNNELEIPVHLAVHFGDGKILEEHIYFDGTAMNAEFEAIAAAATAAEASAEGEDNSD